MAELTEKDLVEIEREIREVTGRSNVRVTQTTITGRDFLDVEVGEVIMDFANVSAIQEWLDEYATNNKGGN